MRRGSEGVARGARLVWDLCFFPLRFSMFGMSLCITLAGLSAGDGEHSLIVPASACAWVRLVQLFAYEPLLGYSFLTASPPQQVEIVI